MLRFRKQLQILRFWEWMLFILWLRQFTISSLNWVNGEFSDGSGLLDPRELVNGKGYWILAETWTQVNGGRPDR